MLEKPDIQESELILCLQKAYGLQIAMVNFLPIGADANAAVYQVFSAKGSSYFLKLRKGAFDKTAVRLPRHYRDLGISQIIACIPTVEGELWGVFGRYKVLLYPFVAGKNGYEQQMSKQINVHWCELDEPMQVDERNEEINAKDDKN